MRRRISFALAALAVAVLSLRVAAQQEGAAQQSIPRMRIPALGSPAGTQRPAIGAMANRARDAAELVSVERIWSESPHNGFTDLARFRDRWYCAFREGSGRSSQDGSIRVLTSADGSQWQSVFEYARQGADLRDPKLSVTSDNRLMLTAAAAERGDGGIVYRTLSWYALDGRSWSDPYQAVEENIRLWRISWHLGSAFSMGYSPSEDRFVSLYTGAGATRFRPLAERAYTQDTPTEATLLFNGDDTALCLLRRDSGSGTTLIGRSRPPYRGWEWRDLGVRLTAPNMIRLPDGRIVAAGGHDAPEARTSIHWLDEQTAALSEVLALPSGGDTGYPGLAYEDGLLWVSYHSSHTGGAGIYLAKIRLQ